MFQAPKLTDAGKNLYYRNMAGEGIKFTTIQLGNGTISGPISAMTALVSAVVTIDAAVKNNAEQYADVSGHFSNAELEEGFYWREIGVFAADPDYPNDRSHDILYCYQNAYDTADFIPVASVETVEKNITVPIIVGDASTVSCTLSSSQVLVSEADLEAHNKDANAHNALFEKINKELEKKQDTITAQGILKGGQDAEGKPTVTKATPGVDYQQPTQVLTESNAMALTDTVPFFSGADGQNRKVTLKKLKEALGVQSASINVTTCAGAAVVCTDGKTTLNGVGSTKFSLPENTGTWEVTATLNGHTASAVVEVTGAMQYNVDLVITSSVAVTHAPTKTSYFTGETFSSAGMVVTATMADGSKKTVTGYTCSPTTMAANTTAVTVSYSEGGVTKTTTTPVTVTSISNTLASNSWATIRAVSDAGKGSNYWSVGDAKGITINGKVGATTFSNLAISVFILGFNHNASREGSNRIHFQIGKINGALVGLVDGNYSNYTSTTGAFTMNTSNTNSGGWNNSHMRKTVLGSNSASATSPTANTLLAALPADLRAVMKPATKYSDNTGGGSDAASYVTSTTDLLPLLSEFEYHGARYYANSAEKNYQAQYDYYRAGNSKVHYKHNATGTAAGVWCRSVYSSYTDAFCRVSTDGSAGTSYAYYSRALAPCFFV